MHFGKHRYYTTCTIQQYFVDEMEHNVKDETSVREIMVEARKFI